ncbi:unnamed protein product, partial [Staurois parvus]
PTFPSKHIHCIVCPVIIFINSFRSRNSKTNKQKAAVAESNGPVYVEIQQNSLDMYLYLRASSWTPHFPFPQTRCHSFRCTDGRLSLRLTQRPVLSPQKW